MLPSDYVKGVWAKIMIFRKVCWRVWTIGGMLWTTFSSLLHVWG